MSTVKRVGTGDYNLTTLPESINPLGNVVISTHTLTLNGNLVITGNSSQTIDQNTPTITLNANLTLANVPYPGSSGIIVNRGGETFTELYWNESGSFAQAWSFTDSTGTSGYALTSYKVLIDETTPTPGTVSGFVNITAFTANVGQSGLYVNSNGTVGELATAKSAKKFAIIFG